MSIKKTFRIYIRGKWLEIDPIYEDLIGPNCVICGYPTIYGLGYPHTECGNRLARMSMTQAERLRETFDRNRKKIAPRIFGRDGEICRRCGSVKQLTIDHVVPLSKGGTNDDENLQVLCSSCNSSKGAR